jgi:hypothetical protein
LLGQPEKILQAKDPITLLARVEGSVAVGHLVPAGGEDLRDLHEDGGVKPGFFGFGLKSQRGPARHAHLGQPLPEGEPQKMRRFQKGAEGEGPERTRPRDANHQAI